VQSATTDPEVQKLYCAVELVPVVEASKLVTIEVESRSQTPSLQFRHCVHTILTIFYHMHHYHYAATGDMIKSSIYLKVTSICRYIFLRFWLKTQFASTKFCDLYVEMVQGLQILIFYTAMVLIANDCGYKFLRFWANPQKYQILVPAKNSHLKVVQCILLCIKLTVQDMHTITTSVPPRKYLGGINNHIKAFTLTVTEALKVHYTWDNTV
jgi:hypothetical protein